MTRGPRTGAPLGPVPVVGARAFLGIRRADLAWLAVLVVGTFLLRSLSPIFPDVLSRPFGGAPVSAWGLGFPYNNGGCQSDVPADASGRILPATTQSSVAPHVTAEERTKGEQHCGLVFDEVYFPVDAAKDLQQPPVDYFDPEPPLAKLLMAPAIQFLGFGGWSWRIACTIAGSLSVGVVYLIAMRLRRDRFFAVSAALLVALDGLAFVESRTGVIDSIAIFLSTLAFYAFLLHWQARTRGQWRATLYLFALVLGLAFGAKLTALAPLAVAAALIAGRLLEPAVRRIPAVTRITPPPSGEGAIWRDAAGGSAAVVHCLLAAGLTALVFGASYARYLTVDHTLDNFAGCSPQTGLTLVSPTPSTPQATTYLTPSLSQAGRNGADAWLPVRLLWFAGDAYRDVAAQVEVSLTYHRIECRDHPFASRWYTWPVQAHPVLFYVDGSSFHSAAGAAELGYITNLGNPAVWWLSVPALLFCAVVLTRGLRALRAAALALLAVALAILIVSFHLAEKPAVTVNAQDFIIPVHPGLLFSLGFVLLLVAGAVIVGCAVMTRRFVPAFIVLGYLATWLMWMPGNEDRVLFSYHMLGALPFAALGLAYALTALRHTVVRRAAGSAPVTLAPLAWAGVAIVVASFVFFYPIWSGAPQSNPDHAMRMWFDSWSQAWR